MSNIPPPYSNSDNYNEISRIIFEKLRQLVDSIEDIENNGLQDIHSSYIRQLVKPLNKNFLHKNFSKDYEYVISKLSAKYTSNNNCALRSINEELE